MPDESAPAASTPAPPSQPTGGPAPVATAQSLARDDDQKMQGVSRSLIIAVGGTGHKILMDVRPAPHPEVRQPGEDSYRQLPAGRHRSGDLRQEPELLRRRESGQRRQDTYVGARRRAAPKEPARIPAPEGLGRPADPLRRHPPGRGGGAGRADGWPTSGTTTSSPSASRKSTPRSPKTPPRPPPSKTASRSARASRSTSSGLFWAAPAPGCF